VASGCEVAAIAWLLTAAGWLGRWKCLIAYEYPGRKQLRLSSKTTQGRVWLARQPAFRLERWRRRGRAAMARGLLEAISKAEKIRLMIGQHDHFQADRNPR
jgi:hypothetical protein